jgi:hypothetical protein
VVTARVKAGYAAREEAPMSDPNRPAPPFSPAHAVWFAMLGSILFYGGVAAFLGADLDAPRLPWWPFAVAAAVCAWLALLFQRSIAEESRSERRAREETPVLVDPRRIRVWALDEAVGVVGLVAALFGGGLATFVPFGLAAAGLLVMHRPR